jgi:hypothetical protein
MQTKLTPKKKNKKKTNKPNISPLFLYYLFTFSILLNSTDIEAPQLSLLCFAIDPSLALFMGQLSYPQQRLQDRSFLSFSASYSLYKL